MSVFPREERAMTPGNKEPQRCSAAPLGSSQPAWRHPRCFSRSSVPGNKGTLYLRHPRLAVRPVSTRRQERRKEARRRRREPTGWSTTAPTPGPDLGSAHPRPKPPGSPSPYKGAPESTSPTSPASSVPAGVIPLPPRPDPGPGDRPLTARHPVPSSLHSPLVLARRL